MGHLRIENIITDKVVEAIKILYDQFISPNQVTIQKTARHLTDEGDLTLLVFPLASRVLGTNPPPEETSAQIGNYLKENISLVKSYNVVKGFLNLVIEDSYWVNYLSQQANSQEPEAGNETVMIEYSSPNTNKPLHLGHIRNNLLGHSISEILKATGKKIIRVNLVNDRGVHICKSMLAYKKLGNNETPESANMKGDHLVGKYYVLFDKEIYKPWIEQFQKEKIEVDYGQVPEISEMMQNWEEQHREGKGDILDLWKKMNSWVYDGFEKTYKELGIEFDKTYYESETYLLGKKIVEEGLEKKVFEKRNDNSVWVDLKNEGLDEKLLIRPDGTSVYITQDLGTIIRRHEEFDFNRHVYVVGNEQEYHFKVLFLILKKLGYEWAQNLFHLSYGMVDLPSGKMKSREGTVVDADDLIAEMKNTAKDLTKELGKTKGMSDEEAQELYRIIGLGALKYFILKVEPKKRMLFDPKESINFNGNTAPFIQYTYARIKSVLRKAEEESKLYQPAVSNINRWRAGVKSEKLKVEIQKKEKGIIKLLHEFPEIIKKSAEEFSPALIANYVYELAKEYNGFYQELPILKAEKEEEKNFRIILSAKTAEVIKRALNFLGIQVPERM